MSRTAAYVQPRVIDARSADAKDARVRGARRDINGLIIEGEDQLSGNRFTTPPRAADPLVPKMGTGMSWLKEQADKRAAAAKAVQDASAQAAAVSAQTTQQFAQADTKTAALAAPFTPQSLSLEAPASSPAMAMAAPADALTYRGQVATAPAAVPAPTATPTTYPQQVAAARTAPAAPAVPKLPADPYAADRAAVKAGITQYGLVGKAAEVANRATTGIAQRAADTAHRGAYAKSIGATDVTGMDSGQAQMAVAGRTGYQAAVASSNTFTTPLPNGGTRTTAVPDDEELKRTAMR